MSHLIYLDTGIFIGFLLKESPEYRSCKEIITAIREQKQKVLFSVLNISEVFYILQREHVSTDRIRKAIEELAKLPYVTLIEVPIKIELNALKIAEKYNIDLTDATTYLLMKENKIKFIYALDKHYDRFKDLQRLTELKY
ncbi:MAG: type II toxin-antitoxin system VapC family toxin [Candidatus Diapherotrites archaeon]|nr:type II toxin-antitoxin system VapC family toxin [Candidatus Diapherotrites archaeon]